MGSKVAISETQRRSVAQRAGQMRLEGFRTELAVLRTARCAAAFEGRPALAARDLDEAWELCLGHRDYPGDPATPPAPPPLENRRSQGLSPTASVLPTGAHPQSLRLAAHAPAAAGALRAWLAKEVAFRHTPKPPPRGVVAAARPGAIAWMESLIATVTRAGSGKRRWTIRKRSCIRRPALWLFLDASRSTGVGNFLGRACGHMASLLEAKESRALRFHVLALQDSAPRWLVRNASGARARDAVQAVVHTAGKSFLSDALNVLHRAQLRRRDAGRDALLLCSDGFVSPWPGEPPQRTVQRFRRLLQAITATRRVAWLHPTPKRSAAGWLARLTAGCAVDWYEVQQ
jgi:Mg-chelatase subunit ChlD